MLIFIKYGRKIWQLLFIYFIKQYLIIMFRFCRYNGKKNLMNERTLYYDSFESMLSVKSNSAKWVLALYIYTTIRCGCQLVVEIWGTWYNSSILRLLLQKLSKYFFILGFCEFFFLFHISKKYVNLDDVFFTFEVFLLQDILPMFKRCFPV